MAALNLSQGEYDEITIANPFLLQEYKGDKLGILDVKLKLKSGKMLNIEVQVETEQIRERDQYDKIKRVISIIITDHTLIKQSEKYHHQFGLYDIDNGVLLTAALKIHTLISAKSPQNERRYEKYEFINIGMYVADISACTGMPHDKVEALRNLL